MKRPIIIKSKVIMIKYMMMRDLKNTKKKRSHYMHKKVKDMLNHKSRKRRKNTKANCHIMKRNIMRSIMKFIKNQPIKKFIMINMKFIIRKKHPKKFITKHLMKIIRVNHIRKFIMKNQRAIMINMQRLITQKLTLINNTTQLKK